jgi:hypothetical protein
MVTRKKTKKCARCKRPSYGYLCRECFSKNKLKGQVSRLIKRK